MQAVLLCVFSVLSLVSSVLGNKVHFFNKTPHDRTICWYGGALPGTDGMKDPPHYPPVPGTFVPAWGYGVTPELVYGADYMFKSIYIGGDCTDMSNVEGEFKFNGMRDHTWFDLSVVVQTREHKAVNNQQLHWLRPADGNVPRSGCSTFPCDTVYQWWDDNGNHALDTDQHELTAVICDGPCNSDGWNH